MSYDRPYHLKLVANLLWNIIESASCNLNLGICSTFLIMPWKTILDKGTPLMALFDDNAAIMPPVNTSTRISPCTSHGIREVSNGNRDYLGTRVSNRSHVPGKSISRETSTLSSLSSGCSSRCHFLKPLNLYVHGILHTSFESARWTRGRISCRRETL